MKCIRLVVLSLLALAASRASAQNLLSNPGFEGPVADQPAPYTGRWQPFSGGAGTFSVQDGLMPRTGTGDMHLNVTATNNTFAGAFQDVAGVTPGAMYTFSGYHKSLNLNPADYVSEVRFEWRNSVANSEVSRNQVTPIAGAQYTPFSLTFPAPAGADTARVVYAIQTFSDTGALNTGDVFLDDFSLVKGVPEPSTLALIGMGGMALLGIRRKRS
jgi:hypothetical protein